MHQHLVNGTQPLSPLGERSIYLRDEWMREETNV